MSSSIPRDRTPASASPLVSDEPAPVSALSESTRRSDIQGLAAATLTDAALTNARFPDAAFSDAELTEVRDLPAGSELGNYVVEACIGRGAMASVYRAEHRVLKRRVALKVMAASLHSSVEARQRFLREARAVAAIQHPHVVTISDAGLVGSTPYLVMELLEGEDLERYLERQGPFSGQALAALALPIVAALAAAHDAGIIHRDLKPGNIFLSRTAEGQLLPKLLDFGISKFASGNGSGNLAMTAFDQLLGSPLYLPPEALQGSRELTARSDQYSLGVLLYECVTGQAPFFREGLVPLLNAIVEGSCPAPRSLRPETPPALESAILRAMSVDPRQRFEHIRDLGRALLPLADLRSQHIWAPVFGVAPESAVSTSAVPTSSESDAAALELASPAASPSALVPVYGALAPLTSGLQRVIAATPRAAAILRDRRRWRVWGALALLVTGCALLALGIARVRAPLPAARAAVAERALSAAAAVSAEVPSTVEAASVVEAAPSGALESRENLAPPADPTGERVAPRPAAATGRLAEVRGAEPASRAPAASAALSASAASVLSAARSPSRRQRGDGDGDAELSKFFFSGAASEGGKAARARPERASKASARARVLVNEAPLFD